MRDIPSRSLIRHCLAFTTLPACPLVFQGRYAQADPLYGRAIKIAEKTLGPEHTGVAALLNYRAWSLSNQVRGITSFPGSLEEFVRSRSVHRLVNSSLTVSHRPSVQDKTDEAVHDGQLQVMRETSGSPALVIVVLQSCEFKSAFPLKSYVDRTALPRFPLAP